MMFGFSLYDRLDSIIEELCSGQDDSECSDRYCTWHCFFETHPVKLAQFWTSFCLSIKCYLVKLIVLYKPKVILLKWKLSV